MEWSSDLSVGVFKIDAQHKELIRRVNSFFEATDNTEAPAADHQVIKLLGFLKTYIVMHFSDEEALQLQYGYPQYDRHKSVHDEFFNTVRSLEEDVRQNGYTPADKALFVATLNRLITHIKHEDKKLGLHIQKCA